MNTMLETATVTVWASAKRVVVMPAAASIEAMIQPPNMLPAGLVWAGIAKCRAASSPRGITASAAECWSGGVFAASIIQLSYVNECPAWRRRHDQRSVLGTSCEPEITDCGGQKKPSAPGGQGGAEAAQSCGQPRQPSTRQRTIGSWPSVVRHAFSDIFIAGSFG